MAKNINESAKRLRSAARGAGLLVAIACLVIAGESRAQEQASFTIDSRFPAQEHAIGDGVQQFAATLQDLGLGAPVFVTPTAGPGILARVNRGLPEDPDMGVDILVLQETGIPELDEVLDLIAEGLPFSLQAWEILSWLDEEGAALLDATLARHGFTNVGLLPVIVNTGQAAAMARGAIDNGTLSKGFLMRSFGFGQKVLLEAYPKMRFLDAVGGGVTNVLDGFRDGSLYAAEFVNPCIDRTLIIGPLGPVSGWRYYINQWQSTTTIQFLMYNRSRFPDEGEGSARTRLLRIAAAASLAESARRLERQQSSCLAAIADAGFQISTLPDNVLTKLRSATFAVLQREAAQNPDVATVLESMRAFVNRHRLWLNHGPIPRDFRFVGWPGWESDL
jgi:TRAP-type mannitol/chloroaromatic compound transport system substrate-binding protein